jgi:uncharacterized protein HemX
VGTGMRRGRQDAWLVALAVVALPQGSSGRQPVTQRRQEIEQEQQNKQQIERKKVEERLQKALRKKEREILNAQRKAVTAEKKKLAAEKRLEKEAQKQSDWRKKRRKNSFKMKLNRQKKS